MWVAELAVARNGGDLSLKKKEATMLKTVHTNKDLLGRGRKGNTCAE